jgi:hypothetical protein
MAILCQLTRRSDCAVCSLPWSERGFYDLCGFISSIRGFFLRTVLSLSEPLRTPRHKQDCAAELHLVVDDSLGVRLAGSVNRERQRLAIRRDFKFRVVHYLALHLVGDFERVCVYTLA